MTTPPANQQDVAAWKQAAAERFIAVGNLTEDQATSCAESLWRKTLGICWESTSLALSMDPAQQVDQEING